MPSGFFTRSLCNKASIEVSSSRHSPASSVTKDFPLLTLTFNILAFSKKLSKGISLSRSRISFSTPLIISGSAFEFFNSFNLALATSKSKSLSAKTSSIRSLIILFSSLAAAC